MKYAMLALLIACSGIAAAQPSEAEQARDSAYRARVAAVQAQVRAEEARDSALEAQVRAYGGVIRLKAKAETPLQVLTWSGGQAVGVPVPAIAGHPFSATEVNRSTQTLADGTRIESTTERKIYRDNEGRTRTEPKDGTTVIVDPVAGFRAELIAKTKMAFQVNSPNQTLVFRTTRGGVGEATENLGTQVVNGVSAKGERVTMTIPKGEIGNDRDIKVVTERWTSDELQMLVKSVNRDPRYGETVYELTGVSLAAPDPSLFQVPSDYTVSDAPGRGGLKAITVPGPFGGVATKAGGRGGRGGPQQ